MRDVSPDLHRSHALACGRKIMFGTDPFIRERLAANQRVPLCRHLQLEQRNPSEIVSTRNG